MKTKELNVLVFFMIIAAGEILISCNQAKVQSSSDADSNKKEMKNTIEATQVINEENIDEENEVAYPELIDWSTCYTTLQEAEQKLANWISSHPNVGMHRDLPDDHLHIPFVNLVLSYPETFDYDFPLLYDNDYMAYVTSSDQKLRIYSWDTGCGGTWTINSSITQYKYNGKIKAIYGGIDAICDGKSVPFPNDNPWENDAPYVTHLYDVQDSFGKTKYLVITNRIYSGVSYSYDVMLCKLTAKGPQRVKAFKTGNKIADRLTFCTESRIVEQDADDYIMKPEYNEKSRVLRMPTTKEGGFIDNTSTYKYDGSLFVMQK